MNEQVDKRTASQRIEDLEKVLATVYQYVAAHEETLKTLPGIKADLNLVKDALKLINKRVEATIQSANSSSGITPEAVSALLIKMNVADLEQQTANYVTAGHLAPTDVVADNTFVVLEEFNSDGTSINPRIQFKLDTQDAATQEALKGKKAGDTVSFGEGKFSVKVLEIYNLLDPTATPAPEAAPTAPEAPAEAPAPEAAPAAPSAPTEAPQENPNTFGLSYHGASDPYTEPTTT